MKKSGGVSVHHQLLCEHVLPATLLVNRTGKGTRSDTYTTPHHKGKGNLQEKPALQKQNGDTYTGVFHRKLHKEYPPNINSTEFHKEQQSMVKLPQG